MRVGIIGAGSMGAVHAAGWAKTGADIAGVMTPTPSRGKPLAEQYGWQHFESLDALLAEVDVVDICAPTHLHYDLVMRVAQAGKHVMCEKPIALSVGEGREMIAACQQAGVRFFVGMVIHFFPEYVAVKQAVETGKIGAPQVIRLTRASYRPQRPADDWFFDERKSGGMIVDLMIHDFEYARWLAGDVERVFAKSVNAQFPGVAEDHVLAVLRFKSGAVANIEGGWAYPAPMFITKIEVAGDSGLIEWESEDTKPIVMHFHQDADEVADVGVPGSPLAEDPWTAEIKHFWDALTNDKPFALTAEDALVGLQIALVARESVRAGKPVSLESLEVT